MKQPKSGQKQGLSRKQTLVFWLCGGAIVLTLLVVSIRSVSFGYFDSFVRREASASTATSYFQGMVPTEAEQSLLTPLQEAWDSFRNRRLADAVSVTAEDGAVLRGDYYDEGGQVTVVFLHHYDGSRRDDFLAAPFFEGCDLLLPDARNHGESGGDFSGFGALEAGDLLCWLDWLEETRPGQKVILYGAGMGAVSALLAAEQGLPECVAFLVAESPYASLDAIAKHLLMQAYKVPMFPFYNLMEWQLNRSGAGYSTGDINLLQLEQASLPVLFLMGEADLHVPPEQTQAVYDSYPGPKELLEQQAGYGAVYAVGQEEIEAVLSRWMDEYLLDGTFPS